jgi:hypothetical protein
MSKRVFISYSHKQKNWVLGRLKPCLEAGGAEVLLDLDRFQAGRNLVGQMDQLQDSADASLLVLTPDYLQSDYCQHEMKRSIARDPRFVEGRTVPIVRETCQIPARIDRADPLRVDLTNDRLSNPWDLLLEACGAKLGTEAPHWLDARDSLVQFLERKQSVNLRVTGQPAWRPLLEHIQKDHLSSLAKVDLDAGATASRPNLIREILRSQQIERPVPAAPDDLRELHDALSSVNHCYLAMIHFDNVSRRGYGEDLFSALRHLIMESRKLTLLVQSRQMFTELIAGDHPLSTIDVRTVELNGRTR